MSKNFLGSVIFQLFFSHPLSQTFEWCFSMNPTVHFRHSNVKNCIDKNIVWTFVLSFFSTSFRQHALISAKTQCKSLGENYQALRDLEKDPQTKTSVKNMMHPAVKPSSIEITNALNALQNFVSFSRSWRRYARGFAKIRIIAACAWRR